MISSSRLTSLTTKLNFAGGKKGKPRVVIYPPSHRIKEQIVQTISDVFVNEPTTHAMGYTRKNCRQFFRTLVGEALDDANANRREVLSVVAKHARNIAGVMINRDFLRPMPWVNSHFRRMNSIEAPIMQTLEQKVEDNIVREFLGDRRRNQIFLMGWLAIPEAYQGKGLASRLVSESLWLAKRHRFNHAIAFTTSAASKGVFAKQDFTPLASMPYIQSEHPRYRDIPGELTLMHLKLR